MVAPPPPASITFIQPNEGFQFIQDTVPLFSTTTMSDNPIKKVSFFEDGELLFADHYPPYQYLWTESKDKDAGFYTMEAIAYSQSEEVIASAKAHGQWTFHAIYCRYLVY